MLVSFVRRRESGREPGRSLRWDHPAPSPGISRSPDPETFAQLMRRLIGLMPPLVCPHGGVGGTVLYLLHLTRETAHARRVEAR